MTTAAIPDVTSSIMMIITALGGTSRVITNVTSGPADVTSVVSKLASLLNYTESTFGSSRLPTPSTVFNWTQILDGTTDYNYLILTDTDMLSNDSSLPPDALEEFYDDLVNRTTDYLLEGNISFSDQIINVSSPVNFSGIEKDLLNSTDDRLSILSSDTTQYFDMTNNVSFSNTKSTTFDIFDVDLDLNSRNLSSEQHLDNMSDTFSGNFLSTKSVLPSDSVTVENSSFGDGDMHSTSPEESEQEQLMSALVTTLTSLLAQNRDFSNSSEHIKQVSQILQTVTTGFTDTTRCYSTQCHTAPTDATWEPPVTFKTITGKDSPGSIATGSTVTLGKPFGKYNINIITILLTLAIPVTGHGGLEDCEMLRIPHCLVNWRCEWSCQPKTPALLYFPERDFFFCF
jgi:hypothetical protein